MSLSDGPPARWYPDRQCLGLGTLCLARRRRPIPLQPPVRRHSTALASRQRVLSSQETGFARSLFLPTGERRRQCSTAVSMHQWNPTEAVEATDFTDCTGG